MKYLTGILFLLLTEVSLFAQSVWFYNNKQPIPDSITANMLKDSAFINARLEFRSDTNYLVVNLVNHSNKYFKFPIDEFDEIFSIKIIKSKNHIKIFPTLNKMCGNGIKADSLPPGYMITQRIKFAGYKEYTFDEDTMPAKVVFSNSYGDDLVSEEFALYFPKRKYKTKDSVSGRFLGHYGKEIAVDELKNIIDSLVVYNIYTNTIDERYVFSQATIVLVTPGGMKSFPLNSNKLSEVVLKEILDLPAGSKILIDNIKVEGEHSFDYHYLYPVVYNIK